MMSQMFMITVRTGIVMNNMMNKMMMMPMMMT